MSRSPAIIFLLFAIVVSRPCGATTGSPPIDEFEARLSLARALALVPGREVEALTAYNTVIGESDSPRFRRERLMIAMRSNRPIEAIDDFRSLFKHGHLSRREEFWFGTILVSEGYFDEALRLWEHVLTDSRPVDRKALDIYLGIAGQASAKLRAEQWLTKLAGNRPDRAILLREAGRLAMDRGDQNRALDLLKASVAADSEDDAAHVLLGEAYFRTFDRSNAWVHFFRAVELNPKRTELRRRLAAWADYENRGDDAEVLRAGLVGEEIELEREAIRAQREGRWRASLDAFDRLAAHEPDSTVAYYGRAGSLAGLGDWYGAAEQYEAIADQNPFDAEARGAAGEARSRTRPRWTTSWTIEWQSSSDRQADVTSNTLGSGFELPFGTQRRTSIVAQSGADFSGNNTYLWSGGALSGACKFGPDFAVEGDLSLRAYTNNDLPALLAWRGLVRWTPSDSGSIAVGIGRENWLENQFAIQQGIQADEVVVLLNERPAPNISLNQDVALRRFNDENWQVDCLLNAEWTLLRSPGELSANAAFRYITTSQTSSNVVAGGRTEDVIHPYWTPKNYVRGTLGIRWEHQLSSGSWYGIPERRYHLEVASSFDSDLDPAILGGAGFSIEIGQSILLECTGWFEQSPQYQGAFVTMLMGVAF